MSTILFIHVSNAGRPFYTVTTTYIHQSKILTGQDKWLHFNKCCEPSPVLTSIPKGNGKGQFTRYQFYTFGCNIINLLSPSKRLRPCRGRNAQPRGSTVSCNQLLRLSLMIMWTSLFTKKTCHNVVTVNNQDAWSWKQMKNKNIWWENSIIKCMWLGWSEYWVCVLNCKSWTTLIPVYQMMSCGQREPFPAQAMLITKCFTL